jgi:hypothetical protein
MMMMNMEKNGWMDEMQINGIFLNLFMTVAFFLNLFMAVAFESKFFGFFNCISSYQYYFIFSHLINIFPWIEYLHYFLLID